MSQLLPAAWDEARRIGFLKWLSGAAGVLTDRADGTLVFSHLSFQEFLAAWHLNANVVGAEVVSERFADLACDKNWWETLLLWTALIGGQSQSRLTPVMNQMLSESYGISLVGMMLADGAGTDDIMALWTSTVADQCLSYWPKNEWHRCMRSWMSSHQDDRKRYFSAALVERAPRSNWLG